MTHRYRPSPKALAMAAEDTPIVVDDDLLD